MIKLNAKIWKQFSDRLLWIAGRLGRARFWYLASRMDVRVLNALNVFFHSVVSMVILGVAAHVTSWSLIFPSLGPTIFLLFYAPSSRMAAPRNAVLSHLSGALTGWICFQALLLIVPDAASSAQTDICRIVTAAVALGLCGIFMSLTGIVHPPAASTTLIAGLGMMNGFSSIGMLCIAVIFLCVQAWVMHRLAGIKYPVWKPADESTGPELVTKLGRLSMGPSSTGAGRVHDIAARLATRQKLR